MNCEKCDWDEFDLERYQPAIRRQREYADLKCRLCGFPVKMHGPKARKLKTLAELLPVSEPTNIHGFMRDLKSEYMEKLLNKDLFSSAALAEIEDLIRNESDMTIDFLRKRYSVTMKNSVSLMITNESDKAYMKGCNNIRLEIMRRVADEVKLHDNLRLK